MADVIRWAYIHANDIQDDNNRERIADLLLQGRFTDAAVLAPPVLGNYGHGSMQDFERMWWMLRRVNITPWTWFCSHRRQWAPGARDGPTSDYTDPNERDAQGDWVAEFVRLFGRHVAADYIRLRVSGNCEPISMDAITATLKQMRDRTGCRLSAYALDLRVQAYSSSGYQPAWWAAHCALYPDSWHARAWPPGKAATNPQRYGQAIFEWLEQDIVTHIFVDGHDVQAQNRHILAPLVTDWGIEKQVVPVVGYHAKLGVGNQSVIILDNCCVSPESTNIEPIRAWIITPL